MRGPSSRYFVPKLKRACWNLQNRLLVYDKAVISGVINITYKDTKRFRRLLNLPNGSREKTSTFLKISGTNIASHNSLHSELDRTMPSQTLMTPHWLTILHVTERQ